MTARFGSLLLLTLASGDHISFTLRVKAYPVQTTLRPQQRQRPPLRHGSRQYIPIVQPHRGEVRALTKAPQRARDWMTPHIEVATMIGEPEDISPQSPLARIGDTLRAAVSEEDLFFLDFNEHISRSVLMHVLQDCCAHGLQFIPVITSARATYAPEILAAAGRDRGVCLRMSAYAFAPSGFALDDEIQELLATAKMQREAADLLLDLGYW